MNKLTILFGASAIFLASCVSNPDGKKAEATDAEEVVESTGNQISLNTSESHVLWEGNKVTGKHNGAVAISNGVVSLDDEGNLIGGDFVIDLNTIDVQDLEGEYKEKLTNHLKSDDFFDVENHPEAKFEITSVKAGEEENHLLISGNLTIRGVTKNITFDAHVEEASAENFVANADFNIDREEFNVSFKGKPDDLISKEINFKVFLTTKS